MTFSDRSHPWRHRAGKALTLISSAAPLSACSAPEPGAGLWWFASLAFVVVAVLAYALGGLHARLKLQGDPPQGLASADTQQRPLPGQTAGDRAAGQAPHRSEVLDVDTPPNQDGGSHESLPESLRAAAALLLPTLRASSTPLLLAWDRGQGWMLADLNSAARELWPELVSGTPLSDLGELLPATVLAALDTLPAGGTVQLDAGWKVSGTGTLHLAGASRRGAVLAREAAGVNDRTGKPDGADIEAEADADRQAVTDAQAFSFTLSHDLRAPIRVVEGFTRIVKEDYGTTLDRVGNDHLDRVLGAAARMNLMIDALLTLARLSTQPLTRQSVNLSQLAAFVTDELRSSAPERAAEISIEPGLMAQGDPTLLRLVLENLLGNAWKYSARNAHSVISLRSLAHGDQTAYEVRDNGAGFDMRGADRLFGLFQRLHSASEFPGHGVGLASVQRIVRRHGGEIWAESEPGRGAAFFFTLSRR